MDKNKVLQVRSRKLKALPKGVWAEFQMPSAA